jgi:protein-S-isoprenylcysteine O-methyltransferase Ste14
MTTLVLALGWRPTWIGRTLLVAVVVAATGAFLALGALAIDVCGLPALAVQAVSWAIWLLWLGAVFPRSRVRAPLADLPYRRAFLSEILPGIGCSFAQLARPAFEGLSRGRPFADGLTLSVGLLVALAGVTLIVLGASALGVARTLFVHEYLPVGDDDQQGTITRSGIYSYIRHPLFVGGIACSVGLALCVGTRQALVLAALNLCSLPAYVLFEDLRCSRVIGPSYVQYREAVGAVVPRVWRLTRGRVVD